jgi:ribonuclease VapC
VIVVDSSAVLSILLREGDQDIYADIIQSADSTAISAASVVEVGIVLLTRHGPAARQDLDDLLHSSSMRIEAVSGAQIDLALSAYQRFGKRRGHPARLNFGDCFSYALAATAGEPLLFKGDDFGRTDVRSAVA